MIARALRAASPIAGIFAVGDFAFNVLLDLVRGRPVGWALSIGIAGCVGLGILLYAALCAAYLCARSRSAS